MRRCEPALAPVACGAVLLCHAGRNAPAVADRQAVLLRPGPDITRALPAGRGPPGPAGLCPAGLAGVLHIGRELPAERGTVLGIQVDLIIGALEGEPQGLRCRAAGQIVFQRDGYLLGRRYSLRWMMPAPYPGRCPPPSRNAADPAHNSHGTSDRAEQLSSGRPHCMPRSVIRLRDGAAHSPGDLRGGAVGGA